MATILKKTIKQTPTITFDKCVTECEKILGVLGIDQLVNLSVKDRMKLSKKFEYNSYDSRGILSLQALVPKYAIKKDSLLLKQRENSFVTTAQHQHAQKLYDKISRAVNSYPYGVITCYEFEQWIDEHLRLYIMLKYDKDFEGDNIL